MTCYYWCKVTSFALVWCFSSIHESSNVFSNYMPRPIQTHIGHICEIWSINPQWMSIKVSSYPTINKKTTSFLIEHKDRDITWVSPEYWVKTKKFGATGYLDNGLRRFQPRLHPAFLYNIWGEVRSQVGMVGPQNLALLWSTKFCNFHTRLVHSGCSRKLTSSGLSSWTSAKWTMLICCFLYWNQ